MLLFVTKGRGARHGEGKREREREREKKRRSTERNNGPQSLFTVLFTLTHMPMTTARESRTVQSGNEGPVEKERLENLSDLGDGAKREPELGRRARREEREREREGGRVVKKR